MRQLETSSLSNQNISAFLLVHTYTADADRAIFARIHVDQVAGNGDYQIYATIQAGGAGSAFMEGPVTTFAVPSGQTSIGFVSILIPVNNGDVVKFYVKGLAGDTVTPDIASRIFELTYLRPTTPGRTLDVAATGEAGVDLDNIKDAAAPKTLTNITVPVVTTVTNMLAASAVDTQLSGTHGSGAWGAGGNGGSLAITDYPVTDVLSGLPVQGATVELYPTNAYAGIIDQQITDVFGHVTFSNLIAGTYYLKIIRSGYETAYDSEVVS